MKTLCLGATPEFTEHFNTPELPASLCPYPPEVSHLNWGTIYEQQANAPGYWACSSGHLNSHLFCSLWALIVDVCNNAMLYDHQPHFREEKTEALKAEANCWQAAKHVSGCFCRLSIYSFSSGYITSICLWETTSPPFSVRVTGVEVTVPAPQGWAHDLGLANHGIPSPGPCDQFRARHTPQARPTDSTQGLVKSPGKVSIPLTWNY